MMIRSRQPKIFHDFVCPVMLNSYLFLTVKYFCLYYNLNFNKLYQHSNSRSMSFSQSQWETFDCLNSSIVSSLRKAGFQKPTKIQAQMLEEYKHYYDFLIASQTGSGKTLAFGLPIISELLDFHKNSSLQKLPSTLLGLIITPTRELAQQIQNNINQVLQNIQNPISIVSIIGGMSKHKQLRVIRQRKPHIIIGTPGRIHQFLQDQVFNFQYLKYLVLDQADRMIELGHFHQVDKILYKIFKPKVKEFYEKDFQQITQSIAKKDKQKAQKQSLCIKKGGKKVKLNFDLHSIESDKLFQVPMELFKFVNQEGQEINSEPIEPIKIAQHEEGKTLFRQLNQNELFWLNKLKRRIFFVSATLTRQFKGQKYSIKKKQQQEEQNLKGKGKQRNDRNKGNNRKEKAEEQNPLQSIPKLKALLSRVNFSAKPKIIDQSSELFLPEGLTQKLSFTDGQAQRTSLLICYLKSLDKNSKVIIFTNTIKASKRIQFFIEALDFKCANLHSHMEQKMRLTKLQRFKKSENINILISTDVSARGLDFSVSNVIQYGVPLNGDTYVHRAGRTARANRKGEALIIVDRTEGQKWSQINDILVASCPNRKVDKFCPSKLLMDDIQHKITQLEWIRVNNERQKDIRSQKMEQMEAQQLGVQAQEQQSRRKYDLDKQEQQMVRHQVKKKVQKIKNTTIRRPQGMQLNPIKWKKNKLVLSPEQIMKLL